MAAIDLKQFSEESEWEWIRSREKRKTSTKIDIER